MKFLYALVAAVILVGSTSAMANSIVAPGKVFYVTAGGEMVKRDVSLEVPARGQGDVILRGGDIESTAHAFYSSSAHGRTIFTVVFIDPHNVGEDLVLRGTYMRGTNKAVYFGDFYTQPTGSGHGLSREAIEADLLDHHGNWTHSGGFKFKSAIN